MSRARVMRERRLLVADGIPTLVVDPGPEVIASVGTDFMSDARVREIVAVAVDDTRRQLRMPLARSLLAPLRRAG